MTLPSCTALTNFYSDRDELAFFVLLGPGKYCSGEEVASDDAASVSVCGECQGETEPSCLGGWSRC